METEKRLIDANALSIQVMDASYWDNQDEDVIWNLVQDAPTVDAVCVVRCKDCKHFYHSISSDRDGRCVQFGTYDTDPSVYLTDFCSYGERRTNEPEKPV